MSEVAPTLQSCFSQRQHLQPGVSSTPWCHLVVISCLSPLKHWGRRSKEQFEMKAEPNVFMGGCKHRVNIWTSIDCKLINIFFLLPMINSYVINRNIRKTSQDHWLYCRVLNCGQQCDFQLDVWWVNMAQHNTVAFWSPNIFKTAVDREREIASAMTYSQTDEISE